MWTKPKINKTKTDPLKKKILSYLTGTLECLINILKKVIEEMENSILKKESNENSRTEKCIS